MCDITRANSKTIRWLWIAVISSFTFLFMFVILLRFDMAARLRVLEAAPTGQTSNATATDSMVPRGFRETAYGSTNAKEFSLDERPAGSEAADLVPNAESFAPFIGVVDKVAVSEHGVKIVRVEMGSVHDKNRWIGAVAVGPLEVGDTCRTFTVKHAKNGDEPQTPPSIIWQSVNGIFAVKVEK